MGLDPAHALTAIFTKRPAPGRVKTRLCPPLSHEQAAALAEAMLRDTVQRCARSTRFRTALVFAPAEEEGWFRSQFPELEDQRPQRGDGLGERLAFFFEEACQRREARTLVAIGSDQPLVRAARIEDAHRALHEGADCVLGPDQGGGTYLIGLSASHPELFTAVPMSTAEQCARTAELARSRGLTIHWLPPELDVDLADDLVKLRAALAAWCEVGGRSDPEFPGRTQALVRELFPGREQRAR